MRTKTAFLDSKPAVLVWRIGMVGVVAFASWVIGALVSVFVGLMGFHQATKSVR